MIDVEDQIFQVQFDSNEAKDFSQLIEAPLPKETEKALSAFTQELDQELQKQGLGQSFFQNFREMFFQLIPLPRESLTVHIILFQMFEEYLEEQQGLFQAIDQLQNSLKGEEEVRIITNIFNTLKKQYFQVFSDQIYRVELPSQTLSEQISDQKTLNDLKQIDQFVIQLNKKVVEQNQKMKQQSLQLQLIEAKAEQSLAQQQEEIRKRMLQQQQALETEIVQLKQQLDQQNRRIESLQITNQQILNEKTGILNELSQKMGIIQQQTQKIKDLEADIQEIIEQEKLKMIRQEQSLANEKQRQKQLQQEISKLEVVIREQAATITTDSEQQTQLRQDVERLTQEVQEAKQELNLSQNEIQNRQNQIDQSNAMLKTRQAELDQIKQQLKTQNDINTQLVETTTTLKQSVAATESRVKDLEEQLKTSEQRILDYQEQIQQKTELQENLITKDLQQDLARAQTKNQQLKTQYDELMKLFQESQQNFQEQLEELQNKKSEVDQKIDKEIIKPQKQGQQISTDKTNIDEQYLKTLLAEKQELIQKEIQLKSEYEQKIVDQEQQFFTKESELKRQIASQESLIKILQQQGSTQQQDEIALLNRTLDQEKEQQIALKKELQKLKTEQQFLLQKVPYVQEQFDQSSLSNEKIKTSLELKKIQQQNLDQQEKIKELESLLQTKIEEQNSLQEQVQTAQQQISEFVRQKNTQDLEMERLKIKLETNEQAAVLIKEQAEKSKAQLNAIIEQLRQQIATINDPQNLDALQTQLERQNETIKGLTQQMRNFRNMLLENDLIPVQADVAIQKTLNEKDALLQLNQNIIEQIKQANQGQISLMKEEMEEIIKQHEMTVQNLRIAIIQDKESFLKEIQRLKDLANKEKEQINQEIEILQEQLSTKNGLIIQQERDIARLNLEIQQMQMQNAQLQTDLQYKVIKDPEIDVSNQMQIELQQLPSITSEDLIRQLTSEIEQRLREEQRIKTEQSQMMVEIISKKKYSVQKMQTVSIQIQRESVQVGTQTEEQINEIEKILLQQRVQIREEVVQELVINLNKRNDERIIVDAIAAELVDYEEQMIRLRGLMDQAEEQISDEMVKQLIRQLYGIEVSDQQINDYQPLIKLVMQFRNPIDLSDVRTVELVSRAYKTKRDQMILEDPFIRAQQDVGTQFEIEDDFLEDGLPQTSLALMDDRETQTASRELGIRSFNFFRRDENIEDRIIEESQQNNQRLQRNPAQSLFNNNFQQQRNLQFNPAQNLLSGNLQQSSSLAISDASQQVQESNIEKMEKDNQDYDTSDLLALLCAFRKHYLKDRVNKIPIKPVDQMIQMVYGDMILDKMAKSVNHKFLF